MHPKIRLDPNDIAQSNAGVIYNHPDLLTVEHEHGVIRCSVHDIGAQGEADRSAH